MKQFSRINNPWLSMLYKPRATIQQIIDNDPRRYILLLAALHGTINTAARQIPVSLLNDGSASLSALFKYSLTVLIAGPIGGILCLYLFSFVVRIAGILLKGKATPQTMRAAMAWSAIPFIWGGLLYPITFLIWWKFQLPVVHSIVIYTVVLWALIIHSKSIAQVQKYKSAGMGFINIIIPIAFLFFHVLLSLISALFSQFSF